MKIVIDKRPLDQKALTLAEFLQDVEDAGVDLATVHVEDENGDRFSAVKVIDDVDGVTVSSLVLCRNTGEQS